MGEYDAGYEHYIDGLHREIEKLQEQLESVVGRSFRTADKMERLEDENAKLRELVLTLYMCSEFLCWRCKHERGNTCDFDAENELRELGIEVDE